MSATGHYAIGYLEYRPHGTDLDFSPGAFLIKNWYDTSEFI